MTAPSLLDELEGVVRRLGTLLPELEFSRETHVQWRDCDQRCRNANPQIGDEAFHAKVVCDYDERLAAIKQAMEFIRTHHAEIADMAKRLEAAERDGKRWRFLRAEIGLGRPDVFKAMNEAIPDDAPEVKEVIEGYLDSGIDAAINAATQEGEG